MKKRISIFISGNFNIIHPGHIRLFKYAKKIGNYLIVGLKSDNLAKNQAYISEKLRYEGLKNISLIDEVHLVSGPLDQLLLKLKPNFILKGKEYKLIKNHEEKISKKINSKLIFSKDNLIFSAADLTNKEIGENNEEQKEINNFLTRNKIDTSSFLKKLSRFNKLKVCVIGDLIVDEYNYCQPVGMSREEAVIVMKFKDKKTFIGGAGAVASYAKKLCSRVYFFSVMGNDKIGRFVNTELRKRGIINKILIDKMRPTSLKVRFRDENKSLLRVSYLNEQSIEKETEDRICKEFKKIVNKIDLIIFSDFNYGLLTNGLIHKIKELCKNKKIIMTADSQSSSQEGNISRFVGMNLITPTEKEARICILDNELGLENLAKKIQQKSKSENVILKLGREGALIVNKKKNGTTKVDRIPAIGKRVVDTSGAGDALLTIASLSLTSGSSIEESSYFGSVAAGVAISKYGNIPISSQELKKAIEGK